MKANARLCSDICRVVKANALTVELKFKDGTNIPVYVLGVPVETCSKPLYVYNNETYLQMGLILVGKLHTRYEQGQNRYTWLY